MSVRRVWIVGAGKRVLRTALPAIASIPESFEVAGVLARTSRGIETGGRKLAVRAIDDLRANEPSAGDLVYVAVGKDSVPAVLARLLDLDRANLQLLVDTPVLRFKHLRHARLLEGWSKAGVAEDTAYLPWYETAREAAGRIERIVFDRSAYAYHGLAQAKALAGSKRVVRARRMSSRREIALEGGVQAVSIEPRDYAVGRVVVEGPRGRVADRLEAGESGTPLVPVLENGLLAGFRAGDVETRLSPEEARLALGDPSGASVTARMESMKRIGFRRLLASIAAGDPGYPVEDGLEDMAVDWFLERFGRWRRTGLTDVRSRAARAFWGAAGRIG